jgi:hypothetical protein
MYKSGRAGVFVLDGGKPDGKGGGSDDLLGDPKAKPRDDTPAEIARLEEGLPADPVDLPLERCSASVDDRLAESLTGAWRLMLEAVRPDETLMPGLDGTTYIFSMESDGRALAGETWTPREGTRPARLARLAEAMREYCERPATGRLTEISELAHSLSGAHVGED